MATLQDIKHVCFDKDGVIIDVHQYWNYTSSLRTELIQERYHLSSQQAEGLLQGMGIDVPSGRIKKGGPVGYLPRKEVVDSVVCFLTSLAVKTSKEEISEIFRMIDTRQQASNDYHIEILPGVRDFLAYLCEKDVAMTIYTSDRRENVFKILEHLSIRRYFRDVVGGGCVTHPKPHPEGFLIACERTGVSPAESAYIGDTIEDLKMGSTGGAAKTIGVETGLNTLEELLRVTPYAFKNLAALMG